MKLIVFGSEWTQYDVMKAIQDGDSLEVIQADISTSSSVPVPDGTILPGNKKAPKCASCGREWHAFLNGEKMDFVVWATPSDNGAMVTMDINRSAEPRVRYTLHTGKVTIERVT